MGGLAWSQEALDTVRTQYGYVCAKKIAAKVGRSESAVRNQAASMGIASGGWRAWTASELKLLRAHYATRGPVWVGFHLKRSEFSVTNRARDLGLKRDLKARGLTTNGCRAWTADEDATLRECGHRTHRAVLAKRLNRSERAVAVRLSRLRTGGL